MADYCLLTTAGDGTWILGTAWGRMLFARWHRTTPSIKADGRSSGNVTFNLASMICPKERKHTICQTKVHITIYNKTENFCLCRFWNILLVPIILILRFIPKHKINSSYVFIWYQPCCLAVKKKRMWAHEFPLFCHK